MTLFQQRLTQLRADYITLINRSNPLDPAWSNGVFERYVHPVVTAAHVPLEWRYDLNPQTNPFLMERLGVNAVFNAGAIELDGKMLLVLPRGRRRSQIVLCGGRECQRHRRLSLLGRTDRDARDRRSRHQRVRHAPGAARRRLDLRPVLHANAKTPTRHRAI